VREASNNVRNLTIEHEWKMQTKKKLEKKRFGIISDENHGTSKSISTASFCFLLCKNVWNSDFKEFRSQSIIVPSLKMSLYPSKNLNIFMVFLLSNKTKSHCAILNKIEYFWIKEEKTSLSFFKYFWKKTKKKFFFCKMFILFLSN
jgi:hypothetical protein